MHKQLVAGLSRLVICLQSNFIGTNFAGFCSNLGVRGLFSAPFVSYWVHIDWLALGYLMGAGNPTISRETKTQVPAACQPQPWQPHIRVVNKADFFFFLEFPWFFCDPVNTHNLILSSLSFLNPTCTSGSSQFKYYWSLAWMILNIILLVCDMSAIIW